MGVWERTVWVDRIVGLVYGSFDRPPSSSDQPELGKEEIGGIYFPIRPRVRGLSYSYIDVQVVFPSPVPGIQVK